MKTSRKRQSNPLQNVCGNSILPFIREICLIDDNWAMHEAVDISNTKILALVATKLSHRSAFAGKQGVIFPMCAQE